MNSVRNWRSHAISFTVTSEIVGKNSVVSICQRRAQAMKMVGEMMAQMLTDCPSPGDTRNLLIRYGSASPDEREAMDTSFVWLTGYTLESLAARAAAGEKGDYEDVVAKWRTQRPPTRSR